jgi:4,5-dihydroxyphthalate decarboxylase
MTNSSATQADKLPSGLDLDRYAPAYMTVISNRWSSKSSAQLRERFDIGIADWRLMALLANEPWAQASRVEEVIGMDKTVVSRTAHALEARGLLVVRLNAVDPRRREMALSKEGRRLHDRVVKVALKREQRLLHGFSEADKDQLFNLLSRLQRNLPLIENLDTELPESLPDAALAKEASADGEVSTMESAAPERAFGQTVTRGRLSLSVAIGPYDRVQPLADGQVQIDGVDPIFMFLEPEEVFFRAFRQEAFDVCELSLSSTAVRAAQGNTHYIGIPVFPSRTFRHSSIYIRTDRNIATPQDLRGKRVGIPEYQLTSNVWARALLAEDYGIQPSELRWIQGGQEQSGRIEKIQLALGGDVTITPAPEGATLSGMLASGEIDALMAPRAPSCFERQAPNVGRLFADASAAAAQWFRRSQIFPIMHVLSIRRCLAEEHPWLPVALMKAFMQAKDITIARLADPAAAMATLPFVDTAVADARQLMGHDYWPYGFEANRETLDFFLKQHHAQGLSSRRLKPEELFHPSTLEAFKI